MFYVGIILSFFSAACLRAAYSCANRDQDDEVNKALLFSILLLIAALICFK
jgi:hypothetical protein